MINVKNKIYEIIELMDEIFDDLASEVELNNKSTELINSIIEGFRNISEVKLRKNNELILNENNFADELVLLVNDINNGKENMIFSKRVTSLFNAYEHWKNKITNILKFKIVVYGLNKNTIIVNQVIDKSKVDIINYVDTTGLNIGKCIDGKIIIAKEEMQNIYFDYIILCEDLTSDNNLNLNSTINFGAYMRLNFDYNFYKKYCDLVRNNKVFDGIITGLSYAEVGINTKYFNKNFFNFAVSSQDIFYDYEMAKYILNVYGMKNSLKYAIISLAYYSFDYDMSKSSKGIRTNIYYPFVKNMHNYTRQAIAIKQNEMFFNNTKNILQKDFYLKIYDLLKEETEKYLYEICDNKFNHKICNSKEIEDTIIEIKQTFNKNYPGTQKENINILEDYLNLLIQNNIKPIIVICPESEFSRKYIDNKMEVKFLNIIKFLKQKYNFLLLNYFNDNGFNEEDFYDGVHLNHCGARKFTKILNNDINSYIKEW